MIFQEEAWMRCFKEWMGLYCAGWTAFACCKSTQGHVIKLSNEPAVDALRPCANIMYDSLQQCGFDEIICVVLTGMRADGTNGIKGLAANHKKIHVIAQDEESCVVYGMPKAIAQTGLVDEVVSLVRSLKK